MIDFVTTPATAPNPPASPQPGTLTLQFTLKIGGVPTDASDGVTLRSPDGTFGVKRQDTGATIVSAATPMTRVSAGRYQYVLTTPDAGLTYSWFAEAAYGGATYHFEQVSADPRPSIDLSALTGGTARWAVVTPPTIRPVTSDQVREWINSEGNESDDFYNLMIDAATRYAEESMNVALCPQTIAAVFNAGEPLTLPRGPLLAIGSVNDAKGNTTTDYTLKHAGRLTTVCLTRDVAYPVTVVYRAGFVGPSPTFTESPAAIPADIALSIMTHVGTLYEARESTTDAPRTVVPHSLDAFYSRRNRNRGIG